MQRKIPKAAGATALRLTRGSAPCRREAGHRLRRVEVGRTEEQSRKVGGALSARRRVRRWRRAGEGGGVRRGGGADGGVRQGRGQRGGRHREEVQVANGAAAILPAAGRAGRCERVTPFLLNQAPPFNQPLRAKSVLGGVSNPLSQGH